MLENENKTLNLIENSIFMSRDNIWIMDFQNLRMTKNLDFQLIVLKKDHLKIINF